MVAEEEVLGGSVSSVSTGSSKSLSTRLMFSGSQSAASTGPECKMLNYCEDQSDNVIIIHSHSQGAAGTNISTDEGRFHHGSPCFTK